MDRRLPGHDARGGDGEDSYLSRILGVLGLPAEVDRDGPVREALVVQAYRLSRAGSERRNFDEALRALIGMKDSRLVLPLRGVRLCRALGVPGVREVEEKARKAGILPFHFEDVLQNAGKDLLSAVEPLIRTPRRMARTAKAILKKYPSARPGVIDLATVRFVRRLATGVRGKKRGTR